LKKMKKKEDPCMHFFHLVPLKVMIQEGWVEVISD